MSATSSGAVGALDLRQLCETAGVTPRTVHFYIQNGLLPPAGSPGPGAKYQPGHLARLRLIRQLKRGHLPLGEIRKLLSGLSDDEVSRVLGSPSLASDPDGSSAIGEVRRALASASAPQAAPASERSQWERVVLDVDVEIHVRRPLSRDRLRRIEQVIAHAQDLLTQDPLKQGD